jgi:hypothetical protein
MKAEHPLTKADERRLMDEFERDRREREQALPPEQRHASPAWLAAFWKRLVAS